MKKNMGKTDKIIRLILAALFLIVALASDLTSGVFTYILIVLAVIFMLTSFISFCPLYIPLKINTCPNDQK